MKRTEKLLSLIGLALCVVSTVFIFSCSNDEFFDFRNEPSSDTRSTRDFSERLSVSSSKIDQWTDNDYLNCSQAIERLGVCYSASQGIYTYNVFQDCNISDTLIDIVVQMIEHTNHNLLLYDKKLVRVKTRSLENENDDPDQFLPDCVPAAIAHMGSSDAPSYDEAIAKCDELFPNWRSNGGVPIDAIEDFIEEYTPVTEYSNLDFCPSGQIFVPNLVTVYGSHAVNAYRIFYETLPCSVIYYHDSSSTSLGDGFILGTELSKIFVFD
ncbi:MAG: hypothetical protein K6F98_00915 [Bacteroidales bacterium]|nr:hypothetical protein [Bacteroidales bacterium]